MKKSSFFLAVLMLLLFVSCRQNDGQAVQDISYESSSFGVIFKAVKVNLKEGTRKVFINKDYRKGGRPTELAGISESEFTSYKIKDKKKFQKALKDTHVHYWKDEYVDKHMMDGNQWSVVIKYQDGTKKTIYGSNDAPKEYDQFIDLLTSSQ